MSRPPVIAGHDIRDGHITVTSSAGRRTFSGKFWIDTEDTK